MAAVNFTLESAKRIAAAVRRVEGTPQNLVGERGQTGPIGSSVWGYLLSCDLSGFHWSWLKLQPVANLPGPDDPFTPMEPDKPLFEIARPVFFSEHTAREINNNRANIEAGTVVKLEFIGYDTNGQPVYVFERRNLLADNAMPLHDHRDNSPFSGGYAWAVYHPGTHVPAQNFPV